MYFMLRLVGGRLYVGSHCAIEWNTLEKKDSGLYRLCILDAYYGRLGKHQRRGA